VSGEFALGRFLSSQKRRSAAAIGKPLTMFIAIPILAVNLLSQEPQKSVQTSLLREAAPMETAQGSDTRFAGAVDGLTASVGQLGILPVTRQPAETIQAALIRPMGLTACQAKVLNAVNIRFPDTHLTPENVIATPRAERLPDETNVNFTGTAEQFATVSTGRYAPRRPFFLALVIGYGPSLHIVRRPTWLDRTALRFSSTAFTAHIDSAWADTPIGALLHFAIDVLRPKARNPCP